MVNLSWIRAFYPPEAILDALNQPIFGIHPLIDFWMLVHFKVGFWLGVIFRKAKPAHILSALVAFEVFEYALFQQGLARKETTLGILLDIVVGYAGFAAQRRFFPSLKMKVK